ncbi:hypothetical protein [Streptomyces johnsoniae]|uniref:Uncharacterized protein n=1 Tax=Streptomyces johnsoniae TaxID=3075532 RepID=A0ABU2S5B0_9ACTN|nr:hypothetical protein [Streptomyces sp. DSM 41886]MDT0443009.1 hypothetical protein [Streptomyces sp. DSM 41886]
MRPPGKAGPAVAPLLNGWWEDQAFSVSGVPSRGTRHTASSAAAGAHAPTTRKALAKPSARAAVGSAVDALPPAQFPALARYRA